MQSVPLFCVLIVLIVCAIISTDALNCYQCNSHSDAECTDLKAHPPHKVAGFWQKCDDFDDEGNPAFCRTISYKFKFLKKTDHDAIRVIRACGYKRSRKECYSYDNDHHTEIVCQCFGDGCNSASNISMFSLIGTMIMGLSTLWLST